MDFNAILIRPNISVRQALRLLDKTAKKVLFVEEKDTLIGALSDGDVRRWILKNGSLDVSVAHIMNKNPIYVEGEDVNKARCLIEEKGISAVPCVNSDHAIINIVFAQQISKPVKGDLQVKVVIMAGGKGERLLPYTKIVPKPLIPIGDKPIVELIIDKFTQYGCKDFTLTINYKKNMIKAYFDELERDYHIHYIEEEKPLGTGGALYFLKGKMEDSFFVSNCDILANADFREIYEKHKVEKNAVTIITSLKEYIVPYGVIKIGNDSNVEKLIEKPVHDYLINTGIYVLEPNVLDYLEPNCFMHITDLISICIEKGLRIGTYPISADSLMDMGQFEGMKQMKAQLGVL